MAKKNQNFLPKRIAGVKVPKSVRKGPLGELIASPAGPALIAEAVMAARAKTFKDGSKIKAGDDADSKKTPATYEASPT
jgi:hypothetical protein